MNNWIKIIDNIGTMKQPEENDDARKLREVFEVLDLDQLLNIAQKLKRVKSEKHGEVILIVKNYELSYVNIMLSDDVRKRKNY